MSQYNLKVTGKMQEDEYINFERYIDILGENDKLTVIMQVNKENSVDEFYKILERNDLVEVSQAILVNDTYKMTYKRKK